MANEIDKLIGIIVQIGNLSAISPDDDLQHAGFSSIRRLELRDVIEEEFNIVIPDDDRFPAARTPRDLHNLIQELAK